MMRRVPDLSKINQLIGYAPTMCLDEILADISDIIEVNLSDTHQWPGKFVPAAVGAAVGR